MAYEFELATHVSTLQVSRYFTSADENFSPEQQPISHLEFTYFIHAARAHRNSASIKLRLLYAFAPIESSKHGAAVVFGKAILVQ